MSERSKGFTIVELIVVIAIIAILAAVTVPSFTRYLDQSRFSNDTSNAAGMTTLIKAHFVGSDADGYSAYDIKELINDLNGSEMDFTPEAVNTGFFWIPEQLKIVALKYEDAEDYHAALKLKPETILLDHQINITYDSPEEMFGSGLRLMTRDGSAVALAVNVIYELASSGSLMNSIYSGGRSSIETYADSLMARFAGIGISTDLKNKVLDTLEAFSPSSTLYISNVEWSSMATETEHVTNVVFAEGITNIPSYSLSLDELNLGTVSLPRTVRTIEAGAFPENSVTALNIRSDQRVALIGEDTTGILDHLGVAEQQMEIGRGLDLILYQNDNPYSIDLSNLTSYLTNVVNVVLTGYRIEMDITYISNSKVHIYTTNGYYGYVIPTPSYPLPE